MWISKSGLGLYPRSHQFKFLAFHYNTIVLIIILNIWYPWNRLLRNAFGWHRNFSFFSSSPFQCQGYFHPKHKDTKNFENPPQPCHAGIHRIALTEFFQMSTHVLGYTFQSFFKFLHHFLMAKWATSSIIMRDPPGELIGWATLIRIWMPVELSYILTHSCLEVSSTKSVRT